MLEILLAIMMALYPYPENISVRITEHKECEKGLLYEVVEVPFKDYVKGVIVNEIGTGWDEDALKAQAMAIKNYALYQYYRGGKWGGYEWGIVYDCDWDMVYNPEIRRSDTDRAVDETWDYIMVKDGKLFPAHFLAWPNACDSWLGKGKCMSQWLAIRQAERGMSWQEILHYAYGDYTLVKNIDRKGGIFE